MLTHWQPEQLDEHCLTGLDYVVSVDLGKSQDFTALVVLEIHQSAEAGGSPAYHLRHLERWEIGTEYSRMADEVCALLLRPPLFARAALVIDATGVGNAVRELFAPARGDEAAEMLDALGGDTPVRPMLDTPAGLAEALALARAQDAEAVGGEAVLRTLTRWLAFGSLWQFVPVVITGGMEASYEKTTATHHVPKHDLVATAITVLQQGRLRIAAGLPLGRVLLGEFEGFRATPTSSAHERYEAREGEHDDIVLAVAQGLWVGERIQEATGASSV